MTSHLLLRGLHELVERLDVAVGERLVLAQALQLAEVRRSLLRLLRRRRPLRDEAVRDLLRVNTLVQNTCSGARERCIAARAANTECPSTVWARITCPGSGLRAPACPAEEFRPGGGTDGCGGSLKPGGGSDGGGASAEFSRLSGPRSPDLTTTRGDQRQQLERQSMLAAWTMGRDAPGPPPPAPAPPA